MTTNLRYFFYQHCLFKPIYWQVALIFVVTIGLIGLNEFYFMGKTRLRINQYALENNNLKNTLQKEKAKSTIRNENSILKHEYYKNMKHYLNAFQIYPHSNVLISHLTELAVRKGMNVKHIALQKETMENDHSTLFIQLGLFGSYNAFIKFYFAMNTAPYLTQMKQFKLEKSSQEGGTLYAELLVHVHLFK